ncbi:Hypothetical_protein [Hexamita inflata]|uniref:Hypothetical_protein n=1 Tax=Hexamita inflata TaxID=28002 RepID=A0AA86URM9_9EUKA|nr:Hypothetical protein HINF_LOCUS49772 [Hexamita inflata]
MLSILLISSFQSSNLDGSLCERGFVYQNKECKCLNILSSNGQNCVKSCEADEQEQNKTCKKMYSKNLIVPICGNTYATYSIYDSNLDKCICPQGITCLCKSELCCNELYGKLYDVVGKTCKSCQAHFGLWYTWDGTTCSCPANSECFCTSELCCSALGKHYINHRCDDCASAYGPGYVWDQNLGCTCQSSCSCSTQLCCGLQNKIFLDGACADCSALYGPSPIRTTMTTEQTFSYCSCDPSQQFGTLTSNTNTCTTCPYFVNEAKNGCETCAEAYGTGFGYEGNGCYCKQTQCTCKTDVCCDQQQLNLINGKCSDCQTEFGNGAVFNGGCKCSGRYVGTLVTAGDKCTECAEMIVENQCKTCADAFGPDYTWNTQKNKCTCDLQTCTCKTNLCCNQKTQIYITGACKSCSDAYGQGSTYINGNCICDTQNLYYGTLENAGNKCQLCNGILSKDLKTCYTCEQSYGEGFIWDAANKFCTCPSGKKCICKTELCCQQNYTHFINKQCLSCLQAYGVGFDWDPDNYKCFCRNTATCKCQTNLCCGISSQVYINNQCQSCPERMNAAKTQCVTCQELIQNSLFNSISKQCDCMSGYKFKNGQCVKSGNNRTVGLAVGIPVGVLTTAAATTYTVKKVKNSKQSADETQQQQQDNSERDDAVQIAVETPNEVITHQNQ